MTLKSYSNLIGYSLVHGIIDLSCITAVTATLLWHGFSAPDTFVFVVTYNFIAFALQAPFGLIVDKFQVPRESAIIGCLLVLASLFLFNIPALVVIISALGNAFFHLGGGSISLNFAPQKAAPPGIFVAPGALGVAIGLIVGKSGAFVAWPFALLLIASIIFIIASKIPAINYQKISAKPKVKYFELVVLLLLLSVAIRSLYGLNAAWKSDITLLYTLTIGIVAGKALGGILADRFGWTKTAIIALVVSAPLLAFFPSVPVIAIVGSFLFQMTMSITLASLSNMLPGRPATAFGLTVMALFIGIVPSYLGAGAFLSKQWAILTIIFISAGALFVSFRFLRDYFKNQLKINL
jgi:MFS transporter, FSR family, fosmidomycin resistance protein